MRQCPKKVINGPCGGYRGALCEVNGECVFIKVLSSKNVKELRELFSSVILDERFKIKDYFPVLRRPLTQFMKSLRRGDKLIIYEIFLNIGNDVGEILNDLKSIARPDVVYALTDSPLGVLTFDPLALALMLKDHVNVLDFILNISMRNKTVENLVRYVVTATNMGLRNLLIVTGDWSKEFENSFTLDSTRAVYLLRLLCDLGLNINGEVLTVPQYIHLGVVSNPESDYTSIEVFKSIRKILAGAEFIITQPIYNVNRFKEYLKGLLNESIRDVPIIPAFAPIVSEEHLRIAESFGIKVYRRDLIEVLRTGDMDAIINKNVELLQEIVDAVKDVKAVYLSTYGNLKLGKLFMNILRKVL
ncbi:MAG: hypothetical protein B6U85_08315 [Desulfurococcales archaeon ex4484_42]|nr:MAG: hypothetical protein B6U85_08315 [Desulfurococcales archaeon ex4484_42]